MVSIISRNNKFRVVYYYQNSSGERKRRMEIYDTRAEACKRKREIESKQIFGESENAEMSSEEEVPSGLEDVKGGKPDGVHR